MREDPGLFPEPKAESAPASKRGLRGPLGERVVRAAWVPVKLKRPLPCVECFQLQHETGGACGPRADARQRRIAHHASGYTSSVLLCTRHADTWRAKDTLAGLIRPA